VATLQFEHVSKRFGEDVVALDDLTLDVGEGEFLILVGPSGCGKTTALRMVAGLEEVSDGAIRIGNRVVNDLPPTERDIAMVFQNYALYPHMSVADNIAFPLRQRRVDRKEIKQRVAEVARLLGIEELLERRPRALSGGQRQRVAIGRALVRRPQAFLMDEPLSNLDAKLRVQMRAELIALHKRVGITTVYVTHDQTEAMTLGDRVVVLDKGVVQQVDTPERLYRQPANVFVAGFIGSPPMNLLEGTLAGGRLSLGSHSLELCDVLRRNLARAEGRVVVGLRPEDFVLDGGGEGALPARVEISERLGPEVLVHLSAEGVRLARAAGPSTAAGDRAEVVELQDTIVARFDASFAGQTGDRLALRVNRERLQLFDPDSGESLLATVY
jgi:multiple sugar transport system ATP-binding protein